MMIYRCAVVAILICLGDRIGAQSRHWTETPNETIWRGRYTNCDKGWAVDLPAGVVAHASLPPSPNHGFLISTVNPGTTAEVNPDDPRIIDIYDEYDALFLGSARAYLDQELNDTETRKYWNAATLCARGFEAWRRGIESMGETPHRSWKASFSSGETWFTTFS